MLKKRSIDRMKLVQTIYYLRTIENKVRFIEERVRANAERNFQEIVHHYTGGRREMVEAIAGEVAEQRRLAGMIGSFRLGIERIRLRLETVLEVGGAVDMLKEVSPLVSDIKKTGIQAVPEFGIIFTELQDRLGELGVELDASFSVPSTGSPGIQPDSDEIKKILLEAREVAKERAGNQLPEPP